MNPTIVNTTPIPYETGPPISPFILFQFFNHLNKRRKK